MLLLIKMIGLHWLKPQATLLKIGVQIGVQMLLLLMNTIGLYWLYSQARVTQTLSKAILTDQIK